MKKKEKEKEVKNQKDNDFLSKIAKCKSINMEVLT